MRICRIRRYRRKSFETDHHGERNKNFLLSTGHQKKPYRFKIADINGDLSLEKIRNKTAELRLKLLQNPNKKTSNHTLEELCKKYICDFAMHEKLTWKEDLKDFQIFLSPWFSRYLSEITKNDILTLHQKITLNNRSCRANRILAKISALFSKAQEWGLVSFNPASHIKRNKEKQRDRFLNCEELKRFFSAMDQESDSAFKSMIWIALLTGGRRDNIRSMKWEQIDFNTQTWTIPRTKNGRPLTVFLPDQIVSI